MPPYRRLQQYAIGISIISILYNGAEAVVSVGLGSESSSRSLVFFGVQSGIEVISAGIVVWRFKKIAQPGEEKGVKLGAKELRYVTVGAQKFNRWIHLVCLELRSLRPPALAYSSLLSPSQPRLLPSSLCPYTKSQTRPTLLSLSPLPPSS